MIKIVTDSACDYSREEIESLGIDVIPLKVSFGSEEYLDGVTLDHYQFFEKLIETDEFPKTSQIPPFEFVEHFNKHIYNGDTIICITLSSYLSGCYQSACLAAQGLEGKVYVVDSENATVGERVLIELALRYIAEGRDAKEIVKNLNEKKKEICVIGLLSTIEYLKKGGRISAVAAAACNLFSIKPVIAVSHGQVVLLGKARGSKNGHNKFRELIEKQGGIDFNMPYCLAYSGLSDKILQKYISDNEDVYKDKIDKLPISTIGCTIGTHVGPDAIAAAFFKKAN